jgi:hypothetical protein
MVYPAEEGQVYGEETHTGTFTIEVEPTLQWVREFGAEYQCPPCPSFLDDQSWHNDICPSYGYYSEEHGQMLVSVWMEHPVQEQRDSQDLKRFWACGTEASGYPTILASDDFEEVVAAAKESLERTAAEIGLTLRHQETKKQTLERLRKTFTLVDACWYPEEHPEVDEDSIPTEARANEMSEEAIAELSQIIGRDIDMTAEHATFGDLILWCEDEIATL